MRRLSLLLFFCLWGSFFLSAFAQSQDVAYKKKITGTGQTTGNIANLSITNPNDFPIYIIPQLVYIPSGGTYQPYVGQIPGAQIAPNLTEVIPIHGYCADVHLPPVPNGQSFPPVEDWIATAGDPVVSEHPVTIVPNIKPPFDAKDIPQIILTPGYKPKPVPETTGTTPMWPGTERPFNGTMDPVGYPDVFAPVIIEALDRITYAFDSLKSVGVIQTPFSGVPAKERESVIQQTFWIYMADVTGERYQKDIFQQKVIQQFEDQSGVSVTTLPEPDKKNLEGGVDAFWNVFVLTGVEAKIISDTKPSGSDTETIPQVPATDSPSDPPPPELVKETGCSVTEVISDTGPKLDYAIADTGTKGKNEKVKEAFHKAIEEIAGIISKNEKNDTVDVGFTAPDMPASAWSLYFPHVVAGQANASAMAIDLKDPLNSAFTTQPLQTKADGTHQVVLKHQIGPGCTSTLIGVNFAKVRASSGLKASLRHIEALRIINFVGEIAIDIVIQRGKGTYKKLSKYLKEKTKDMAEEKAKEFIKEQLEKLNNEWQGKTDEEAEQDMDELLKEIKEGEKPADAGEEAETFLDDWLSEMMEKGDEFDPAEKIEEDLLDKIDSPIDWAPIKTNTYAIGEGSLDVYVDADHGIAKAASGVRYKRVEMEDAKDAEKGGGIFCDEGLASHITSGTITLKTTGKTGQWAGASGEGIFSTGHGIAVASLESFNGMYVIAICECPKETIYTTFSSVTGYSAQENMMGIWSSMFDRKMTEVADQLDVDIANSKSANRSISDKRKEAIQKDLEDAAKEVAQYILPCETKK